MASSSSRIACRTPRPSRRGKYNLALGERRAAAVREYLSSLGVSSDRLTTLSYGKERPVCTEGDESCWRLNHRAHHVVTGRAGG